MIDRNKNSSVQLGNPDPYIFTQTNFFAPSGLKIFAQIYFLAPEKHRFYKFSCFHSYAFARHFAMS